MASIDLIYGSLRVLRDQLEYRVESQLEAVPIFGHYFFFRKQLVFHILRKTSEES